MPITLVGAHGSASKKKTQQDRVAGAEDAEAEVFDCAVAVLDYWFGLSRGCTLLRRFEAPIRDSPKPQS